MANMMAETSSHAPDCPTQDSPICDCRDDADLSREDMREAGRTLAEALYNAQVGPEERLAALVHGAAQVGGDDSVRDLFRFARQMLEHEGEYLI